MRAMNESMEAAKTGGTNMAVIGVATMLLGILAMLMPIFTGLSVFYLVGLLVIAGGLVRMFWAFRAGKGGKRMLTCSIGALTLICGFVLVAHPMFASSVLTILLAFYFLVDGVVEIAAGLERRPGPGWRWLLICGIASVLLGVIIWRQYPLSGVWAIGILLGLKLLLSGIMMITVGSLVRATAGEQAVPGS